MKRFVIAISALTLMLAAFPASATHQSTDLCAGAEFPEKFLNDYINTVIGNSFEGKLCLKGCKSEFQGCKKVATFRKKCQEAAAKAYWTTNAQICQLTGGDKKMCTSDNKTSLANEKGLFKGQFLFNKDTCEIRHAVCKTECNN